MSDDISIQGKYIVGSIRNPWDWYVSLWAFGCDRHGFLYRSAISRSLSRHGLKFHPERFPLVVIAEIKKPVKTWQRTYSNSKDPKLFREWLRLILDPDRKYDIGGEYGFCPMSSFAGFLTYSYIKVFTKDITDILNNRVKSIEDIREFDSKNNVLNDIIRNEYLEEDVIRILRKAGYELSDARLEKIYASQRINSSSRFRDIGSYYDEETVELVRQKEYFIIQKYGYTPPKLSSI